MGNRKISIAAMAVCIVLGWSLHSFSQSVSFQVRTESYDGKYGPKHVGAIWVEDSQNRFVKSLEVWAKKRIQHLIKWQAASGENTVDAVTSATLRSHQTHDVAWNCTDVNGAQVADGTYKIYVEYTEDNSNKSGKPPGKWTVVEFAKGTTGQTMAPPDETYFKDMQLIYSTGGGGTPPISISGTVKEAGSNNSISGATVQLKSGSTISYEINSDSAGFYKFSDIQAGGYTLVCAKSGYTTWTGTVSVNAGQQIAGQDISLTKETGVDTTPPKPPQNIQAVAN